MNSLEAMIAMILVGLLSSQKGVNPYVIILIVLLATSFTIKLYALLRFIARSCALPMGLSILSHNQDLIKRK
jgi:membrane protein DedA with SNARE-associated domain